MDTPPAVRLIDHLKSLGHSNRQAGALLQTGKVWLQGVPTSDPVREVHPEHIEVRENAPRIRPGHDPIILFSDDHLALVWKPPGLLSVAAPRRGADDNLISLMARILGTALPVHRLDEPTSGVMMVARTQATQHALKEALAAHDIERRYWAIVHGCPKAPSFSISNLLVEDRGDGRRGSGTAKDARAATTHFEQVRRLGTKHTLMAAKLETGRTHQVRIHLSEHGLPVIGDTRYAPPHVQRMAPRLALHAWCLGFVHPVTQAPIRVETPLPDDLERCCQQLSAGDDRQAARTPKRPAKKRRRRGR